MSKGDQKAILGYGVAAIIILFCLGMCVCGYRWIWSGQGPLSWFVDNPGQRSSVSLPLLLHQG